MKTLLSSPLWGIGYVAGIFLVVRILFSLKSILFLVRRCWRWLEERTQVYQYYKIPRFTVDGIHENALYRKVSYYISALPSLEESDCVSLFSSGRKPNDFFLHLGASQLAYDYYLGARLSWIAEAAPEPCFLLKLRRQDRRRVLRPYLQHVEALADEIELRRRETKLFTHSIDGSDREVKWRSVPFTHPATFETLAVDPDVKNKVKSDLESFIKGRAYYQRLGRVWRRSYLLHGPPGTGKSSFVAAMAKFLCYDVYYFDLWRISDAAELRSLLLKTSPRSVILVEDLDRYLSSGCEEKITGVLNFMDGIFSCCGDERVMVVTMTTPAVDAAVLRPGRVDVHVHFPMCDFGAFKTLASSYLGLKDHKLYPQVEEGFQNGARLSPAEVGEIMIANRGSPSRALKSVINALQRSSSSSSGNSGRFAARRLSESASESGSALDATASELTCRMVGGGLGFGKDATLREFRKLYGLIKRSTSKRDGGVMTVEAAAAAAAAANAGEKEA